MIKKFTLILAMGLLVPVSCLMGQMTTSQAGFRAGYKSGLFYQVTREEGYAEIGYQLLLSFKDDGVQLNGLRIVYERSIDNISPNLFFSWGYGGHLGFTYSDKVRFMGEEYYYNEQRFMPLFGIDGWAATEYRIHDIPLTVSLNIKPYVEIVIPAFVRVVPWDFAISVAYIF
jgi:hypothetical protein